MDAKQAFELTEYLVDLDCPGCQMFIRDHYTGEELEIVEIYEAGYNLNITVKQKDNECK